MGLLEVVVQVEAGIEVTVSQEVYVHDTASKNRQGSSSNNPPAPTQDFPLAFDKLKGKCICCLEPGHTWSQCKARIPPGPEQTSGEGAQGQKNCGEKSGQRVVVLSFT